MRRTCADIASVVVAIAVLVLGGLAVVKPALDHWNDVYGENPFTTRKVTEKVVKKTAGKPKTTTTTTKEADQSFIERALGNSGLLLLRIAVVALAAFLAAAIVQRSILGDFALKVGPVEVPALAEAAEASKSAIDAVRADLLVTREQLLDSQKRAEKEALDREAEASLRLARVVEEMATIQERVKRLQERSDA